MNILDDILARLDEMKKKVDVLTEIKIEFYKYVNGQPTKVEKMEIVKANQFENFPLKIVDLFGNDAVVDGIPAWSFVDPATGEPISAEDSIALIDPASNGMNAWLKPKGQLGFGKIKVEADADMGAGVVPLIGFMEFQIIAGTAVGIFIQPGEKQDV